MNLSNVFLVHFPNFSLSFSLLFQWLQLLLIQSYFSIIIIIISHIYAEKLQLNARNKPLFWSVWCCICSVFTICVTCNIISHVECLVLFHYYLLKHVCSAKYDGFLWVLVVLSWNVAQVFSEWFWDGSSCPCFTGIAFVFTFPRVLFFCCKVLML